VGASANYKDIAFRDHLTPHPQPFSPGVPGEKGAEICYAETLFPMCLSVFIQRNLRELGDATSFEPLLFTQIACPKAVTSHSTPKVYGISHAPTRVAVKPATPIIVSAAENVCRVCFVDIPVIAQTCQKPLSFIQASGFEPHPIANAM